MINRQLTNPESIVVVGGSNDVHKPGGKVLKNIIDSGYKGRLYVANPKEDEVQGVKSYRDLNELPEADLAIMAIAARHCPQTVEFLSQNKNTRAFIVLSAGFSEESEEGAKLEKQLVSAVEKVNGCLIGPNCIGVINSNHSSAFTTPIPKLDPKGAEFISGSGATAVFIMEAGIPMGLTFSSVYSVGNSAQMGVEDVLRYMDENFDPEKSSRVKLLYMESVEKPMMLLKHASSLIRKGCKIAAVKAGTSEAGSRAASSHTGALASSDSAVDALFRKAGIVRCRSREELTVVASVFMHPRPEGKNFAVITHAGGPAVMLTDTLSEGGMNVPPIEGPAAEELLEKLHPGSSVANPVDFLATGTAEQLGHIIDYCDEKFDNIDAMAVIFGSPGLFSVYEVYDVLDEKMKKCRKPIYPVLPSIINARDEINHFLSKGRINFPDEVALGRALTLVSATPAPAPGKVELPPVDKMAVRKVIDASPDGYLYPCSVGELLDAAGIERAGEAVVSDRETAAVEAEKLGFPVVMKAVGPVHKSDVGGVVLDVKNKEQVEKEYDHMMEIPGTTDVLIQPMLKGVELFAGVKYEPGFGHMILCGLGGIFIEVLRDVSTAISPVSHTEAASMIKGLNGYGIIKGERGQDAVSEECFADIIARLSALVTVAPEIYEMDLNPLMGGKDRVAAVDTRIRVEKKNTKTG